MQFKRTLIISILISINVVSSAQDYAIDDGAAILLFSGYYSNMGGKLFEGETKDRINSINVSPAYHHFITKGLFFGAGLSMSHNKQGEDKTYSLGIGPNIGYAFGNESSTMYPFFDVCFRFMNGKGNNTDLKSFTGTGTAFDLGLIIPVKNHIGIIIEGSYNIVKFNNKSSSYSASGNVFAFGIGMTGLLF